jgi:CRISPR-associated protein Csm5
MAKQHYTVTVTPLTGVHIGTGEELTPLDYKLASKVGDIDFRKPMYWRFSSDKILKRLIEEGNDMTAFDRASTVGNMKELQRFFQAHCTNKSDTDYPCDMTKGFHRLYDENREKDPIQNAAKVYEMYRPEGSARPVIPGSSIKGALRTGVLNGCVESLSDSEYEDLQRERFADVIEKRLLHYNDTKNDPFRALSVGDCGFSASNTQLVGLLKNISVAKFTGELTALKKLQIQAEVIKGVLLGGKASADMTVTIDADLQKTPFAGRRNEEPGKLMALSVKRIMAACNTFYLAAFLNEYRTFYQNAMDDTVKSIVALKSLLEDAVKQENQCIIRVGRWIQVEFVTLDENLRKPKTPNIRGKQLGFGNTRTVFDYDGQYIPLGWCILKVKE